LIFIERISETKEKGKKELTRLIWIGYGRCFRLLSGSGFWRRSAFCGGRFSDGFFRRRCFLKGCGFGRWIGISSSHDWDLL